MLPSSKVVPFTFLQILQLIEFPYNLTNTGYYEAVKFVISWEEYLDFICIS